MTPLGDGSSGMQVHDALGTSAVVPPDGDEPVRWIVGAYSASPSRFDWDPSAEAHYLEGVLALPGLRGLEVPFTDSLHKYDEPWLLARLPHHLDVVVTLIPGTTSRLKVRPRFGLASTDGEGRRAALDLAAHAAEGVHRLNDAFGRAAVVAVELHSAPRVGDGGSTSHALAQSLTELASWDWAGARLVVEHCDTRVDGRAPAKGYLPLEDELSAIKAANAQAGSDVGVSVNWGRSVIEARAVDGAVRHVRQARDAGLLAGVVFSGCAAADTRFGAAWADAHVPPAPHGTSRATDRDGGEQRELLEPLSLMTGQRVRETVEAAGSLGVAGFYGLKIAPLRDATLDERVRTVGESLAVVQRAAAAATLVRADQAEVT